MNRKEREREREKGGGGRQVAGWDRGQKRIIPESKETTISLVLVCMD